MSEQTVNPVAVAENTARLQDLTQRLVSVLANRQMVDPKMEGPGPELYMKAAHAWMAGIVSHPEKIAAQQVNFWRATMENLMSAQKTAMGTMSQPLRKTNGEGEKQRPADRRFANPLWETNPWFHFIRDQYLTSSRAISEMVNGLDDLNQHDRQRVEFFSRQIIDMFSPTNFFATNPDAMEKALATGGKSLVDGMENFVRDLEANEGRAAVSLSDPNAFEVGKNIATAPGEVVYRNRLFELIQYEPETKKVFATPLVILPPWINKFYILDLKPANSFIRYAVAQGFTVFVVSWVNPDETYAETGFDEYVKEGALEAINKVCDITGEEQVNAIGYCIGGTLLGTTLAWLSKGNRRPVANAAFFTTLLDFEQPGELAVFLDDDFMRGLEKEIETTGYLNAFFMARTFSYLRANDLVYGPGVKSYLLGEAPPAFDLLYWNGDSTNLPGKMAWQYLERLYRNNELMAGTFSVGDDQAGLASIDIPVMAIATRTDHIAPWKASFSGMSQMSGELNLVLADSGHIAGIVNPPEAEKYGYWTNNGDFDIRKADNWFSAAERHNGSWWPVWTNWMSERSGKKVVARKPGSKKHPPIAAAPGEYVKMKA